MFSTNGDTLPLSDKVSSWLHTKEFFGKPNKLAELSSGSSHGSNMTRKLKRYRTFETRARAGMIGNARERLGSILTQRSKCSRLFESHTPTFEVSPLCSPSSSLQRDQISRPHKTKLFNEIQAKKAQKVKEEFEAMAKYHEKEKRRRKLEREMERQKELLTNREMKLEGVFPFMKKTPILRPEWFVSMEAEELSVAQAETSTFLVDEVAVDSVGKEPEAVLEEEKEEIDHEVNFEDWNRKGKRGGVVAYDSDTEEKNTKVRRLQKDLALIQAPPCCPTSSEHVDQAKDAALPHQEDSKSMLVKRPPQLMMADEDEEGVDLLPYMSIHLLPKLAGYQRQPAFKLWAEEHNRRIAEGRIPSRSQYIWDELNKMTIIDDMAYRGNVIGKDWDICYGPDRDLVVAERLLRTPGVPLEPWQRKKDSREALYTKQRYDFREEKRIKQLREINQKKREQMTIIREKETLDQERERQKEDRLRAQRNRNQKKLDRGQSLKERLTPEEQKEARRKADTARKQKKRAEEQAQKGKKSA